MALFGLFPAEASSDKSADPDFSNLLTDFIFVL